MLIGEIQGAVSTKGFIFTAYQEVKKFDFVAVKRKQQWILAQIVEITKYPEGITEAETIIIGYREGGLLKRPRYVLKPKSMIYRADQDLISETLGVPSSGLYIGRVETNHDISVHIDAKELFKHLAILAKTGAGKSYLTAVIIEEMLENKYPVIIIDPHGEYSSLAIENELSAEEKSTFGVKPKGYPIQLLSPDTALNPDASLLRFSSKNIDVKDLIKLIPTNISSSQIGILYTVLKDLKGTDYTLDFIIDACHRAQSKTKWGVINLLDVLKSANLFSEDDAIDLRTLVQPGQATIITLKGISPDIQSMVVYLLGEKLFDLRKKDQIPPFFLIVEEAHNFIPEKGYASAKSDEVLRTIASEGRKFGLGLAIVSQRPANVSKNVLSQCNTQVILRVTNPNDLTAISRSFEGVTAEVKSALTGIPAGVGLLLGKEYPILTKIRPRRSKHGGEGVTTKPTNRSATKTKRKPVKEATKSELPPETHTIWAYRPLIRPEDLGASPASLVFYPLWRIETTRCEFFVDAKEGTIKWLHGIEGRDEATVEYLVSGDIHSLRDIAERTRLSPPLVEMLLNKLAEKGLVKESRGRWIPARSQRDQQPQPLHDPAAEKIIAISIQKEQATELMRQKGETIKKTDLIYYPYYTSQTRVFDARTGKELS